MDLDVDLGTVDNESVLTLMECPVCLDHITPPIKQCLKGHLVCSDCFPRLNHCPTCRGNMSEERNLAMEQVSYLLQYPCRYHPMGCKEAFSLAKKSAHEKDCPYLQLKCPFHGQCAFNGSLAEVVPHLKSEHAVTPVPVQPNGILFYRAKNFYRRNIWALIYGWDNNLFRFIIKHVHANQVGRQENCNLLIAHVQYIGPDSMASSYAYQISLFDAENPRRTGPEFQGLVTSTLKPVESQCLKEDVFVTTFHQARNYTDQWANLNFIVRMKKMSNETASSSKEKANTSALSSATASGSSSSGTSVPAPHAASTSSSSAVTLQPSSSSSASTSVGIMES